ncbi:MAG: hypothetical protein K2H36_01295, partial [Clostridia bacterium]|nr:hypothetical protein [Clostridia bacterium]
MDIRKRKIKGFFALSALIIILSLCLAMAIPNLSFTERNDNARADSASSVMASVLNLTEKGETYDHFSEIITGGQNEYIYFGKNFDVGTNGNTGSYARNGAIKWRVLANGDTKYGDGTTLLLYADYQIGTSQYNAYYTSQYYAFWGTSKIRAALNGGLYLNPSGNAALDQTITDDDAWINIIFNEKEHKSIKTSVEYDTKLWRRVTSASPAFTTVDLVGDGIGQYTSTILASQAASFSHVNGTAVIETTQDKLFLLDYFDANNADWGFYDLQSDGTKLVYGTRVLPDWTPDSEGLPGYDDRSNHGSIRGDYLKESNALATSTWFRNVGHYNGSEKHASALTTQGFFGCTHMTQTFGIRPAFNFDPSRVIYATASNVTSIGNTFSSVGSIASSDGKPAYKVYMMADDYVNYNALSSGKPNITATNGSVTVTKSGQSGNAIFLLTDKSGNGSVAYQAMATFNNGVATATLPSNVNASDYSITVLFADSINGEVYSENITGSYTQYLFTTPKSFSKTYTGQPLTPDGETWYNTPLQNAIQEGEISETYYKDNTKLTSAPTDAGTYEIVYKINNSDYMWSDLATGEKRITFTIDKKAIAYPSITGAKSKPYSGGNDVRFQLDGFDPNSMELSWKESYDGVGINSISPPYSVSAQAAGTYELVATIKPDQAINYKFSSTPKMEVEVTPASLVIEKMVASGGGSNSAFSISEGTASISVDIFVDVNGAPLGNDVVPITIYIPYGNTDIDVSQGISLDASSLPSTSYQVTNQQISNLGGLFEGSYSFGVKTTNKNYTVDFK